MLLRDKTVVFISTLKAAVESKVLERNAGIHIAHEIGRGKLVIGISYERVSNPIVALYEFPKVKALAQVFVFKDSIGSDDGGSDVVLSKLFRKCGGAIGNQSHIYPL